MLQHIRPHLILDTVKSVAVSIVGLHLDYCNSLLCGASQRNLDLFQHVQNSLARVVTPAPLRCTATELQRQLHWLPVRQRVKFKLGTVTYRAIHTSVLSYLAVDMHHHQLLRALCSTPQSSCTSLMLLLTSTDIPLLSQNLHLE